MSIRHPFSSGYGLLLLSLIWFPGVAQAQATPPVKGIQGLWVWREETIANSAKQAALLDFCKRWGFNRLLVQLHMTRGDTPTFRSPEAVAALIIAAAQQGVAVEALDGASDMAAEENQPRALAILDAVLSFNQTLPANARFVGIHYDIEPYTSEPWRASEENRHLMMRDLLTFYHRVREKLDQTEPEMTLSADIPMWYDRRVEPGNTCVLDFNGETKNFHEHIQDVCDYIGIMSYRRRGVGQGSVVEAVETELAYAEKIGKTICPALETIELKDEPTITFFGLSGEEFWRQHNLVREALGNRPGFGGMLTHSYDGVRALLDTQSE